MATPKETAAVPAPAADNADTGKEKQRVKIQVVETEGNEMEGEGEAATSKYKRRPTSHPHAQKWWEAKCIQYAYTHPHVRARLEKLMGSNLVRLTDKAYMQELQDRIIYVTEENLNKRIAARELDEMERLKRLILCGKTPLKECPPELYHHPVFVFWRLVNKEVARASKKRADAYYKKLKGSRKVELMAEEETSANGDADVEDESLTPEELFKRCELELSAQKAEDIQLGFRFTDEQFMKLKYEAEDVKRLKALTTVEELYKLADQIIGVPRTIS